MSPLPHQAALLALLRHGLHTSVQRAGLQTGRDGRPGPVLTLLQTADRRIVAQIPVGTRDFSLSPPKRTGRLWGTPSVYRGSFPGSMMTTHVCHVQRLRMSGAIPLLPYTPSWLAHTLINAALCLADRTQHVHSSG